VQSYDPADGRPTDAELLAAATHDDPKIVCPDTLSFPVPMAPPMAAEALDMNPPKLSEVVSRLAWPADADVGIVEAAGGVRSPLAIDGDTVDLCARLDPDVVVLVSDAELGAINGVRTAAACLGGRRLLVYLNRYLADEDVQLRNRQWLAERDGFRVLTDPLGLADAVWDR
jgi:dethiobiotin synthetase